MIRVILYRFRRTSFNSTRQNGILKTILHYEWYIQLLSLTKDIGTCKKVDHIPRYSGTKIVCCIMKSCLHTKWRDLEDWGGA